LSAKGRRRLFPNQSMSSESRLHGFKSQQSIY
jgi:hypothetical protein